MPDLFTLIYGASGVQLSTWTPLSASQSSSLPGTHSTWLVFSWPNQEALLPKAQSLLPLPGKPEPVNEGKWMPHVSHLRWLTSPTPCLDYPDAFDVPEPAAFSLMHRKARVGRQQRPGPAHWPCVGRFPPIGGRHHLPHLPPHCCFWRLGLRKEAGHQCLEGSAPPCSVNTGLCFLLTPRDKGAHWEDAPGTVFISHLEAEGGAELH